MWVSEDGIILVTGGTGFIGRHLVRLLLGHGMRVRLMCRTKVKARDLLGLGPEVIEGDISGAPTVRRANRE